MMKSRIDFRTHSPTDFDLELLAEKYRGDPNVVWATEEVTELRKEVRSLGWEINALRHNEEDWEA